MAVKSRTLCDDIYLGSQAKRTSAVYKGYLCVQLTLRKQGEKHTTKTQSGYKPGMKKLGKKVLILTVIVLIFTWNVQGGRILQEAKEVVIKPQNIGGGGGSGTSFPNPVAGGFGFSPSGSTICSWPRLGCFRIPPVFTRGPSVPFIPGNTPVAAKVSP